MFKKGSKNIRPFSLQFCSLLSDISSNESLLEATGENDLM